MLWYSFSMYASGWDMYSFSGEYDVTYNIKKK